MTIIHIEKLNEVHLRIITEPSVEAELSDYFSFKYPGASFSPKFKARLWDGMVRLFNYNNKTLPVGLLSYVYKFAEDNGYTIECEPLFKNNITDEMIISYAKSLNLRKDGKPIELYDYQVDAIRNALNDERIILLSPTASGKSLIIYMIMRWYIKLNKKCLIIVPTTMLVEQLYKDFADYSSANDFDVNERCQKLYSGFPKKFTLNTLISTWQSIYTQHKSWFGQFDVAFGDEAHEYKAASVTSIMGMMDKVKYRIGTTGTLDNQKIHQLQIEGIFGPAYLVTTTKIMIDTNRASKLDIKCLLLSYDEKYRQLLSGMEYKDEVKFLLEHEPRNRYIANLALNMKGNTLVLFRYIKHGKILLNLINERAKDGKKVFYVAGDVGTIERENIRYMFEKENGATIVASYDTFSTGINSPSIENIIFASPIKSKILALQSIGRGLRLKEGKNGCNLLDICDDLTYEKKRNITLNHATQRMKIYKEAQFNIKLIKVNI